MSYQLRIRISDHLHDGLKLAAKKRGRKNVGELLESIARFYLMGGAPDDSVTGPISEMPGPIQDIIDQLILDLLKKGTALSHKLEMEAWLQHATDEAHSRQAGNKQGYFVCLAAGRIVGPHRLEKLQEWVGLKVLCPKLLVQPERGTSNCPMEAIPDFHELGPRVKKKLEEYRKLRETDDWKKPVTDRQLRKLKYFELPFDREGLTKGRAGEYISCWTYLDPKKNQEYKVWSREQRKK